MAINYSEKMWMEQEREVDLSTDGSSNLKSLLGRQASAELEKAKTKWVFI